MTAENLEELEPEVIEAEVEEVEAPEVETPEGEQAEQQADAQDEEFDIVLEGEEEPAPQPGKMPKRVKKLLDQRNALQTENENQAATVQQNAQEIERLRQELAASRGDQPQQPVITMPLPPTEESVDYDPEKLKAAQAKYQSDLQSWIVGQQQATTTQAAQQEAQAQAVAKEKTALEAHYERADSLKVPDYEDNEAASVEIMGKNLVKSIALALPNSAMVINYLGKNKALAQEIAGLDKTDPQAGVAKLWELNFKLKKKPRTRSNAPEPETSVEGGGKGGSALQAQYDKATNNGNIKERKKLRKLAKEQGITLQD